MSRVTRFIGTEEVPLIVQPFAVLLVCLLFLFGIFFKIIFLGEEPREIGSDYGDWL